MQNWKTTGFIATAVIVLAIPIYVAMFYSQSDNKPTDNSPTFVGKEVCKDCHKKEYDLWLGSHHDKAMDIATNSTVLADFNNSEFTSNDGITSKFYKKDGKFYVYTNGVGGKMYEMEITHTFGYTPLQQYLIPTEKGRYQCLPIAWDTEKKEWFSLVDATYGDENITPTDWLYWTNNGQNWNGMCAECHSTNLQKNFNPETKEYNTTYSEIDVSCEACHGPSSKHVEWARLPEMARPSDTNFDLLVKTSNITNVEYVDLCAYCHSRRSSLSKLEFGTVHTMDNIIPRVIDENYFADGQILEEDYVYASFLQSKMYDNEVQCNDCHDVHSGKRIFEGNALCTQCHLASDYDTKEHHFHKYEGESGQRIITSEKTYEVCSGALCVNCHMPDRVYMGVDWRNDHSIRIPRPDLTIEIGTPNACNKCHEDKSASWSENYITKWYGEKRRSHYGSTFAKARSGFEDAVTELVEIIGNDVYLPIVRATAVQYLENYLSNQKAVDAVILAMQSEEPIIRYQAVQAYNSVNAEVLLKELLPILNDPIKAIRIQAAFKLSAVPREQIPEIKRAQFDDVLAEYRDAMKYQSDFSGGRMNLGIMYGNLKNFVEAEKQYKEAIEIDSLFYPAKVNLSVVLNQLGKNDEAENLLRDLIEKHPEFNDSYYSLGLLLAEKQNYKEAVVYLKQAAELVPNRPRIFYNLGLIQQYLGEVVEAETSLNIAVKADPASLDFIYALADHYIKTDQLTKAFQVAQSIKQRFPNEQLGDQLLQYLQNK